MKTIVILTALSLLTACSSPGRLIDFKSSTNPGNYQADLLECEFIASNAEPVGKSVMIDGAIGAGLGGVAGYAGATLGGNPATLSHAPEFAIIGAVAGMVFGMFRGAMFADSEQAVITTNCLKGRGYTFLRG